MAPLCSAPSNRSRRSFRLRLVERHRLERVDDPLAEEIVIADVARADTDRKYRRTLHDSARLGTRLIVCGDLQELLDRRGRHVRLVLVVRREVAVLTDD